MSHQRAKELAIFRTAVAGASRHRPEPVTRGTGGRKPPASRPSPRPFVGGMLTETAAPAEPAAPASVAATPRPKPAEPAAPPRAEEESLATELAATRHGLARSMARSAELRRERDEAREMLSLALSAGLAAAEEARAEADRVARHAGELSRELGRLRDELSAARIEATSLRARPEPAPSVDEVLLERVAQRAARKAVALQGDAAKLARLAQEHGGVERLERLVEGARALRKAVGE